jgi:hypothetical protein
MRKVFFVLMLIAFAPGCQRSQPGGSSKQPEKEPAAAGSKEARIEANLAKLDAADRKLAEAQKFCAVMTKSRLGSMGTPIKVLLKGQPVFLCCDHCQEKAEAEPEKALAQAEKLKAAQQQPR